ncbi:MAG: hypothetical protein Q8S09_02640 [Hyphomonas sp.]|nr:hypothetical protein [Hyphomonas sp.]
MSALPLFKGIICPPIIRPIDVNGSVVKGEPLETLEHRDAKKVWLHAAIELHPHTDGLWMWSASLMGAEGGRSYKVGPKWGKFAECRRDALFHAAAEILRGARDFDCGPRFSRSVRAWAEGLQREARD